MLRGLFKKKREEKESDIDYLIVGLGNPGERYEKTAHNIGFRVVSQLREEIGLPSFKKDKSLHSLVAKGNVEGKKIVLLLPLTFMNLSGEAVRRAVNRFNLNPRGIIVVHDDTDLPSTTLRFSFSRGSAGHKGVASVIRSVKTKDFFRLRIGARKTTDRKEEKALHIVLKNLSPDTSKIEQVAVEELKKGLSSEVTVTTVTL